MQKIEPYPPETDRINVTVLVSTLTIGGAEQLLLDLVRGIDANRFNIELCFLGEPGIVGSEILNLGCPAVTGLSKGRFDPLAILRLVRIFTRHKTDILLLINHRNCLFYGVTAARLAGVPHIVNWQNEIFKTYSFHRLTMLGRRMLSLGIDTVVAVARGHKRYIAAVEGISEKKIVVIYNGVDTKKTYSTLTSEEAREKLGLSRNCPSAGIVAALRPDKAHEIFLEAGRILLQTLPEIQLIVVGDGPQRDFLSSYASRLGIVKNLHFLGFRRDMADVLKAFDVFCLSSRPEQETLSVAAIEAMSAGIPVVMTDVGCMNEIIIQGETGFLVPVDNPHELADKMSFILKNPEQRCRMGKNAQALVENSLTVRHMTTSFENLFTHMLCDRRTRRWVCAE